MSDSESTQRLYSSHYTYSKKQVTTKSNTMLKQEQHTPNTKRPLIVAIPKPETLKTPKMTLKDIRTNMAVPLNWSASFLEKEIIYFKMTTNFVPLLTLKINEHIELSLKVLDKTLEKDHPFFLQDGFNPQLNTVSDVTALLNLISSWQICYGNKEEVFTDMKDLKNDNYLYIPATSAMHATGCIRLTKEPRCDDCKQYRQTILGDGPTKKKKTKPMENPKIILKEKILKQIQEATAQNRKLNRKLNRLQKKCNLNLTKQCIKLNEKENKFCLDILQTNFEKTEEDSYTRLLLQEQIDLCNKGHGNDTKLWHPVLVKWCLNHQNKQIGQQTNPAPARPLFNYMKKVAPDGIMKRDVFTTTFLKFKKDCEMEKMFVCLTFEDKTVTSGIVFAYGSNEISGVINTEKPCVELDGLKDEMWSFEIEDQSYLLQLHLKDIATNRKEPLAYFNSITPEEMGLYPLFWDVVKRLELGNLNILTVLANDLSVYDSFFKTCGNLELEVPFKTTNIFSPINQRDIFFVINPRCLAEKIHNCLKDNTKQLWKNENITLKKLVDFIPEQNFNSALALFSTETLDTLNNAEDDETLKFILLFCKFFDIMGLNGRSNSSAFCSLEDLRLKWLEEDFLIYLKEWEDAVEKREGNFNKEERDKMILELQILQNIRITTHSVIGIVRFLLEEGYNLVETSHFTQIQGIVH